MPTNGTSLVLCRNEIKATPTDKSGDAIVLQALQHVTGRIEQEKDCEFAPRIATVLYDAYGNHIDDLYSTIDLNRPLLVPQTVIDGAGTTLTLWNGQAGTRATSDYYPYPLNIWPYWKLRLLSTSAAGAIGWSKYTTDWVDAISIAGIWGYHSRYDEAWLSSGDTVQNNPLSSSATTLTVANTEGVDALNRAPRFSPNQLLRIESEYIEVLEVVSATSLTVRRGQRGSTAASHNQNTVIDLWQPDPLIERATLRWVSYLYDRRGEFTTSRVDGLTGATINFPPDVPEEVRGILDQISVYQGWHTA